MPTKFKPDSFEYKGVRGNRQQILKKSFIKNTSKKELIDYINSSNSKPKIRQKCINELTRRGVKLVWEEVSNV